MLTDKLKFMRAKILGGLLMIAGWLCAITPAQAGPPVESYQNQLHGRVKKGDTLLVKDEKFENSAYDWSKIHNKKVTDIITFGLDKDSVRAVKKAFKSELELKIEYWSQPDQADPVITDHVKLDLSYDTISGIRYQAAANYHFQNGYKVKITVNNISSKELGDTLPGVFLLTSQVMVERTYDLDTAALIPTVLRPAAALSTKGIKALSITPGISSSNVSLVWSDEGAQEYDLEWTFIDETTTAGKQLSQTPTQQIVEPMFRNNATRVTVQENKYDITVVNYSAYLLVRIRPVQYLDDGTRKESAWEYLIQDASDGSTKIGLINLSSAWYEPKMNWQYSVAYAEDGKKKESVSFMDGTLRPRQLVTVDNTTKNVIAQETLYDEYGRAVVSVMPTPLNSTLLDYQGGLHRTLSGNYSYLDAYGNNTICLARPNPMSNTAGAAQYYSANNSFYLAAPTSQHKNIPDAEGYPFSVTRYTPDNTGRVAIKGGVGPLFQPGPDAATSKATRIYYGAPENGELDVLFGNDVGYASHYQKIMTVDANGQLSVQYKNENDQVIASALAGDTPTNEDALPSKKDPVSKTRVLFDPTSYRFDNTKLSMNASTVYLNTVKDNHITLTYNVNQLIKTYQSKLVTICSNCYYLMNVDITGDCNNVIYHSAQPVQIGSATSDCNNGDPKTGKIDNIEFLDPGSYNISFSIQLSDEAMANYTEDFVSRNPDLKKNWQDFDLPAIRDKDYKACFDDCTTCKASLGQRSDFISRLTAQLAKDGVDVTTNASYISFYADSLYTVLSANCTLIRKNCVFSPSPCDELHSTIVQDVSPGGQYALFDANGVPLEASINVIALHWRDVGVFDQKATTDDQFETEQGVVLNPHDASFTLAMLVQYWNPTWADRFIQFHPEVCAWHFCQDFSVYKSWDMQLQNMCNTLADLSELVPAAQYSYTNVGWLVDNDPFFKQYPTYATQAKSALTVYTNAAGITGSGSGNQLAVKSLSGFVDYMLYCSDPTALTNAAGIINNDSWSNCTPVGTCRIFDQEWRLYRDKYLDLKQTYYQAIQATSAYCGGSCAIGVTPVLKFGNCPEVSDFSIALDNPVDSCAGQNVKVSYNGAVPLSFNDTIRIYYPAEYNSVTNKKILAVLPAGARTVNICIDASIDVNAIHVASASCPNGGLWVPPANTGGNGNTFDCNTLSVNNFNTAEPGNDSQGEQQVIVQYTGPAIPSGKQAYVKLQCTIDGSLVTFQAGFNAGPSGQMVTVIPKPKYQQAAQVLSGSVNKIAAQCGPFSILSNARVMAVAVSSCDSAYQYKVSRITSIHFGSNVSGVPSDTATLNTNLRAEITSAVHANCVAEADDWIQKLSNCMDKSNSQYTVKMNQLRAALIDVCSQGADQNHPFGASTTPDGQKTASGYASFKDAIIGVFGSGALNMMCNPYLIDGPDPYNVHMQATDNIISRTSTDICSRLQQLTSEVSSDPSAGGSLYQHLKNKYGDAMTMTASDLDSLKKGCLNCSFLLSQPLTLPVFFDPAAVGVVNATQYNSAVSSLNSEFTISTTDNNYQDVFTNYLNQKWGFTLSYDDYQAYATTIAGNPAALLVNKPAFKTVTPDPYACMMDNIDDAVNTGNTLFRTYIDSVKQQFRKDYIAYCSKVMPQFQLTSSEQYYHFMLYYYDQAGNMIRTVPPEGVHPLDESQQPLIDAARKQNSQSCSYDGPANNTDKTAALSEMSTLLQSNTSSSLEMWLYNAAPTTTATQLLATTSDRKYFMNICLDGRYAHLDIYSLQASADGTSVDVTLSRSTAVDMEYVLPLRNYTHFVCQGDVLDKDNLAIYVNGVLCPTVTTAPPGGCGWELGPTNGTIVYPENLANVKQIRFYNRTLTDDEIAADAGDACMGLNSYYATGLNSSMQLWSRFNAITGSDGNATAETQVAPPVYPKHMLATSYAYQSLNGVYLKNSIEEGTSRSFYDNLGRMVISQDAEQALPLGGGVSNRFSYVLFDDQNRTIETGEKSAVPINPAGTFMSAADIKTFNQGGTNEQIVRTYYDQPYGAVYDQQENLRKRVSATSYQDQDDVYMDPQQITFYSYDALGNVKTLWQQIDGLNDIKRIDYQYDLISGNTNQVRYQYGQGKNDHFYYGYEYDAENRLLRATSAVNSVSTDGWKTENPKTDATYNYYLHGPLSRAELGNDQLVQGLDYAYTLQGWLKGVNGQILSASTDMGNDGEAGGVRTNVGKDVYGYALDYYTDDYKAISGNTALPIEWINTNRVNRIGADSYNGNVSRSTIALSAFNGGLPVGYTYRYDQLNRLTHMRYQAFAANPTAWNMPDNDPVTDPFHEDITYDGNGNILSYTRNGNVTALFPMDKLQYQYTRDVSGNLMNNSLHGLNESAPDNTYSAQHDIKPVGAIGYSYDRIGNLIVDRPELSTDAQGNKIEWTVYGKVKKITKPDGSIIQYTYDPAGRRVSKQYTHNGVTDRTWYVLDNAGTVLAVYGNQNGDNNIYWKEQHLYGRSRLGIWEPGMPVTSDNSTNLWETAGLKTYELTNHLGNVMATIQEVLNGSGDASIISQQDYYPFGMIEPGRNTGDYRYGFNGKENDNEVKDKGNEQDYGMRVYDPRIGKFLSLDPLASEYPWYTPYQFAGNKPVNSIDRDGLEEYSTIEAYKKDKGDKALETMDGSDGAWLTSDRLNHTDVWKAAMQAITVNNWKDRFHSYYLYQGKIQELRYSFGIVRDYYNWIQNEVDSRGYQSKWAMGASYLVDDLSNTFDNGTFKSVSLYKVGDLMKDLNQGIANYAVGRFHGLFYGGDEVPAGSHGWYNWDYQFITQEQVTVVAPGVYKKYSGTFALWAMNKLSTKWWLTGWAVEMSSKHFFPDFSKFNVSIDNPADGFGAQGRLDIPMFMLWTTENNSNNKTKITVSGWHEILRAHDEIIKYHNTGMKF
jgi:RHS repeat-associated protein